MFHQQLPTYTGTSALPTTQHPPAPFPSGSRLDLSRVPPSQHTAAYEYDSFVSRLTFNSKDLITSLTRVAGENLHNTDAIVAVLEQRILSSAPPVKLPMLYLVDSIVKNIGGPYVNAFRVNLFHTFTHAYGSTTPQVRMSMHRLLGTWPPVFGMEVVTAMRRRVSHIDAASQPHPSPPPMQSQEYQGLHMPRGLTMPQGLQMPPQIPQATVPSYSSKSTAAVSISRGIPHRNLMPQPPAVTSTALNPSAPSPQLGLLRSEPLRSAQPRTEGSFLQVQSTMEEVSRKASMGIAPSNHQIFTINRLITTLLPTSLSPEREALHAYQAQLRELPTRLASSAPSFPPPAAAYPPPPSVPVSDALTNLLRNPPPGLLAPQAPTPSLSLGTASLADVDVPRHRVPPPRPQLPQQPDLPKVLKFADLKTISHAAAVRSLYADLPHLSKSDGMRFAAKEQLREHLDWLFLKNRSKRARERGLAVGGSSRCWFDKVSKLLGEEDENESDGQRVDLTAGRSGHADSGKKGDRMANAIVATGASEKCMACQEEIESFWSDEEQAWMLKDAIRTEDGEVYHRTCVESSSTPRTDDGFAEGDQGLEEETLKAEVDTDVVVLKIESEAVKTEEKTLAEALTPVKSECAEEKASRKRGRGALDQSATKDGDGDGIEAKPVKKAKVESSVV